MMPPLIRALRIKQWTKNAVVLAPLLFAFGDQTQSCGLGDIATALGAALLFCMVSSGVYLANDVRDAPQDRKHPRKKNRPIASGDLAPGTALVMSALLLIVGLSGAFLLAVPFGYTALGYVGLQAAYTYLLKQLALVDLFVIALGFVLRALGGAAAIQVPVSPWLLMCTMLLALFLALCKRRHEKSSTNSEETRSSLSGYSIVLLDQLIAITASATAICYSLYTLWPDTVEKFGTNRLGFTIPLVLYGLFRYLDLVYRQEQGDRPEQILLTDPPILITCALYGLSVLLILWQAHV